MKAIITGSSAVISRSGYTTLMELVSLQRGAVIIPTPGQTEQEYLGEYLDKKWGFVTLTQDEIPWINDLEILLSRADDQDFPESGLLLDAALRFLTEQEI
jgi:UDP-N-acetylglucosamine:LPS N-acetylglucosamine transferase